MNVLTLTSKPTVADEVRASVVKVLEDALAEAKDGNVSSVLVIAVHPDGEWSDWQSATDRLSEMIGRIEIAKQKRISHILRDEKEIL